MLIQAYKRTKNHDVDLRDIILKFRPNGQGHIVCDVKEQRHIDVLLAIPTGFRAYEQVTADEPPSTLLTQAVVATLPPQAATKANVLEQQPPAGSTENQPDPTLKYLLLAGEQSFDLRPLDDDALRAFAAMNDIKVHHAAKGDTIRDKIVEGLAARAAERAAASGTAAA